MLTFDTGRRCRYVKSILLKLTWQIRPLSNLTGLCWSIWPRQGKSESMKRHSLKHYPAHFLCFCASNIRELWIASARNNPLKGHACIFYFENDTMIDFAVCSQSSGAALAQQGERKSLIPFPPCFISHCKWMCVLPCHLIFIHCGSPRSCTLKDCLRSVFPTCSLSASLVMAS